MSVNRSLKPAPYPAVVHDPDLALVRAELQRARVVLERIDQHLLAREAPPPPPADWHGVKGGFPHFLTRGPRWWGFWR